MPSERSRDPLFRRFSEVGRPEADLEHRIVPFAIGGFAVTHKLGVRIEVLDRERRTAVQPLGEGWPRISERVEEAQSDRQLRCVVLVTVPGEWSRIEGDLLAVIL